MNLMENTIIEYFLKVLVATVIFYGIYVFCMRNDTFFKLRRIYLLLAITVPLIYPALSLELSADVIQYLPAPISHALGLIDAEPVAGDAYVMVGEGYGTFETVPVISENTLSIEEIVLSGICLIMFILALRFIVQLTSILALRARNVSERVGIYRIIRLGEQKSSSFSFFHWIFIYAKEQGNRHEEILVHEMAHARQFHSVDIILAEIFSILCWWNPFAWLLRREVKINLEYLADKCVLDNGYNVREYQYLLLQTTNMNTGISIINNFNVSQLKKRITMINKKQTSILFSAKYLLILPIIAGLILSNAVKAFSVPAGTTFYNDADLAVDEVLFGDYNYDDKPFVTVEQMPSYPGGEKAMQNFIKENLMYPVAAVESKIQGRVTVRYVVGKDGVIRDIKVVRGLSPECDAEAVRLVSTMPKWVPGKQNGIAVPVYFTLPIIFRLKDNATTCDVVVDEVVSHDKPLLKVEQMPSFPGGEKSMQDFIGANLKYPAESQKKGIQGRVTVRFVVDQEGTIKAPTVIRGIGAECDAEAVRVIESMPKWVPGKQNGKNVPVYYTIPIVYRLTKKGSEKIETATYPGGMGAFNMFFANNLKYPVEAQSAKEVGLVVVKATILKTGEIGAVSVEKSVSLALDKEVVRVAKSMQNWIPEKIDGEPVESRITIPVAFRLKTENGFLGEDISTKSFDNVIIVVGYSK